MWREGQIDLTARGPRRKRTDTCRHRLPRTPHPPILCSVPSHRPSPAVSLFSSVASQNLFLSQQLQTVFFFPNHKILSSALIFWAWGLGEPNIGYKT